MKTARTTFDKQWLVLAAVMAVLYATAIVFRPALPIDETRYLTVAWEMLLRHDWFAPLTVNFQPYHHKPPILFWMIQTAWAVFGVSRWAAVIPVVLASFGVIVLTSRLCRRLVPDLQRRAPLVMLGSFAFLIYSTAILFDLSLTVFVLGALLCMLAYARDRHFRYMIFMGLLLGIGVLTKGPVAYLYVIFPVLLARYWIADKADRQRWYSGHLIALGVSLIPVLLWLVPVLRASNNEFGYWLVWEQTAGRITGNYASSHDRPVYFYFGVLPLLLLPWTLMPRFWKGIAAVKREFRDNQGIRFLVTWLVPTFIAFSLIGGKQPHYMVPLLPGFAMLIAWMLSALPLVRLRVITAVMLLVFVGAHVALAQSFIARYNLQPMADQLAAMNDRDLAFVGSSYHGEFNFLARLKRPLDTPRPEDLQNWFHAHPDGFAVVRYLRPDEIAGYDVLMQRQYRGRNMAIISLPNGAPYSQAGEVPAVTRPSSGHSGMPQQPAAHRRQPGSPATYPRS